MERRGSMLNLKRPGVMVVVEIDEPTQQVVAVVGLSFDD